MKLLPPLVGAALALAVPAAAQAAAQGAYVQVDAGVGVDGRFTAHGTDILVGPIALNEQLHAGYLIDALVGRDLPGAPLAVEAEALYVNNGVGTQDLNAALGVSLGMRSQSYGASANLKVQPRATVGGFTLAPFVAGGLGYGHSAVSILGDHYGGDGLLWQAKAGVALETSPRFAWVLSYRYLGLPSFDVNKLGLDARLNTRVHAVSVGVRYSFR